MNSYISKFVKKYNTANQPLGFLRRLNSLFRWNWTDAYDWLIESRRRAVEENLIGHAFLSMEARPYNSGALYLIIVLFGGWFLFFKNSANLFLKYRVRLMVKWFIS